MKVKNALILALFIVSQALAAQNRDVLFYINQDPIYATDFKAIYNKNKDVGEQIDPKTPEEYLELYINFKLKVKEATESGMDTAKRFQQEFMGYRNTLAKPYFTDTEIDERLVKEAYERMLSDVRAAHIMFELPRNPSPADTLRIYNEALKIRKEIINGSRDFATTAKEISKDTYSAVNGGDLGYFTAFSMVYPFETAAYTLEVGELSMPVRTQFGYHIVKTLDKRPARGQVEVAHIMVSLPEEAPEEDVENARKKINDIFQRIKRQESFEALARQYSDDKSSGRNGGRLQPFGINTMVREFEEEAFKLNVPTAYSEPFRTKYGFHVVQLIRKIPVPSFEEAERDLRSKVQRDSRSNLSKETVLNRLKQEYNFNSNTKNINRVVKFIKPAYLKNEWSPQSYEKKMRKPVFSFADRTYTQSDLITFMVLNQNNDEKSETVEREVYKNFNNMSESILFNYEDNRLEQKYDDFRLLVNEYRDGILLFEIMEERVWGRSLKDTAGLMEVYNDIKENHKWGERAVATIIKISTDRNVAAVERMLRQGISADSIARSFNKDNSLEISYESLKYEKGDNPHIDKNWGKKGIVRAGKEDNRTVIIQFQEYLAADYKKLNEIRGIVTTEFQNRLEEAWIKELRSKFTVKINEDVKKSVVQALK